MGPVTTAPVTMHLMILVSLAAAASASPQIVPYEHVEIAAEPYVHEEIELSDLALGIINRNKPETVPAAAPVVPQQFAAPVAVAPQQFAAPVQQFAAPVAAPVAGVWTGTCLNNLGQGVACRSNVQAEAPVAVARQQFVPQAQFVAQQQFVPQQQFVAQQPFSGVCVNNLGAAVACSQ